MSSLTVEDVLLAWLISRRFGARSEMREEPRRKRRRTCSSQFHTLYTDLRQHPNKFSDFCRLSISTFDRLLEKLRPGLTFQDTNTGLCISPEEQLMVTLRFLSTGNTFTSLHFEFLLDMSTIDDIVRETCKTIWARLKNSVMPPPTTQQWLDIAQGFMDVAQFPNCIGALHGKQIRVKKLPQSRSRYHKYKQFYSVVLLALADSTYRFTIVDVGAYGSSKDARVFRACRMGWRLKSNQLALPKPRPLPGFNDPEAPFVIVADEGFALSNHIMRPFPRRGLDKRGQVFNYRLNRAKSFVKCAFGILVNKWQVLNRPIQMDPLNAEAVIKACVILHNYSRIYDSSTDVVPHLATDPAFPHTSHRVRPGTAGLRVRDLYADFFMSPEGAVAWEQDSSSGER